MSPLEAATSRLHLYALTRITLAHTTAVLPVILPPPHRQTLDESKRARNPPSMVRQITIFRGLRCR